MATSFLRTGRICCGLKVCVCVNPSWRGAAVMTYSTKFGDPKKSTRRTHIKKAKPKPKLDVAQLLISLGMRPPVGPSTAAKAAAMDVLKHSIPATPATPTTSAARASGTGLLAVARTPVPTVALPLPERPIPAVDSDAAPPPPTNELPLPSAAQRREPVSTAESFSSRGSAPLKQTEAKSAVAGITVMEAAIPPELTGSSPPCAVDSKTPLEPPPASAVGSRTPLEPSLLSILNSSAETEAESEEASVVLGGVSEEAAVLDADPDLVRYVETLSILEVASFLESIPTLNATTEDVSLALSTPAEDVKPSEIASQLEIAPFLESSSVPDLTPHVEAISLLEVASFLETVPSSDATVASEDPGEPGPTLEDVSVPDLTSSVQAVGLLEVGVFLEDISALEKDPSPLGVSSQQASPGDSLPGLDSTSLLEVLEDASVPDLTTHLEAVSLLEVAQFFETVPDTDTAAVRFETDSPDISTEEPPPSEGGTPSTDGPPLDHTSSWSTATGTSPDIDSTPTETATEQDLASAGTSPEIDSTLIEMSPEVLGAAKSLQSDLESTDIIMTIPTDSVSEHVTMTIPSLTEPVSEVISVTSLDATSGGAGITCDEAAGLPVATQEPPPNMETGDVLGSAQIAAPREELSDSAPREELAQECSQSGMDPVQKLFLQKIREYQTLSQSPEGTVVMAAEFQQRLAEEEAKLQRLYGGHDLTEFPEFRFPEPKLDETSTK